MEDYPASEWAKRHPSPSSATDADAGALDTSPTCLPVESSEALPARLAVTSSVAPVTQKTIFVSDLFSLFKSNCGGCHVDGSSGNYHVASPSDFPDKVDQAAVDRILTDDPMKTMPPLTTPTGKLASRRSAGDPVLELASSLQQWIAAGRPRDVFYPPVDPLSGVSPYVFSNYAGDHFTNLGSCIPTKRIVATEKKKSEELDTFFASLTKAPPGQGSLEDRLGLPERLEQTDLFTFDTETLAAHGVIAFAPAYPLWSDNAGKLRHVRVPRGQSIRFNKETQSFDIPANTRLYKTFLKKIIDVDGVVSYRKVETRIIVARPDIDHDDGTHEQTALFGSYAWNDDETEAVLVTDPLRSGEPFRDRLLTIVIDEPAGADVRAANPKNLSLAYERAGAIRRYAIPGRDRCVQCHMGSANKNFVLGFLPVQIHRRPLGQSGLIEPAGRDELTQLERLVDYGVITGIDSVADVLPLESLEGTRKPRNDYELTAQGYMLGNCSHCHNPRGFPSITAPVLANVLNFLPGPEGGVFQFPLETTSPRIFRGLNGDIPIAYITPSLMDIPPTGLGLAKWDFLESFTAEEMPKQLFGFRYNLLAPWRSLIYRNVDTPFAYADDNALFPHMPMNVPGYDCRAPRILGDWMVSIPAAWKDPTTTEFAVQAPYNNRPDLTPEQKRIPPNAGLDWTPQPYAEIKPGDAAYPDAVAETKHRMNLYHTGMMDYPAPETYDRYDFCADTSDIVDPVSLRDPINHPVPGDQAVIDYSVDPPAVGMPNDRVPDRPHWVVTDLSEVAGDWEPRRSDWKTILVDRNFPELTAADFPTPDLLQAAQQKQAREKGVVNLLESVTLTSSFRSFALEPRPYGLWQRKDGCNFSSERTVQSYAPEQRPGWMSNNLAPDAPVYTQRAGEAVYNMICVNCHGINFDSLGRQADNLVLMTGGNARVANFRYGLFGPTISPGDNRLRVFGGDLPTGLTPDDMGARYMAWMALGGTSQTIPPTLLGIVANTDVLGVKRTWSAPVKSANMLDIAKALCANMLELGNTDVAFKPDAVNQVGALITANGDSDLWPQLCSRDNRFPVRAVFPHPVDDVNGAHIDGLQMRPPFDFYPAEAFDNAQVVDSRTKLVATGVAADNLAPWCLRKLARPDYQDALASYRNEHPLPDGTTLMPYCPDAVVPPTDQYPPTQDGHITSAILSGDPDDLATLWATRGAINAGRAVFLYLDEITHNRIKAQPRYDHCELLAAP